MRAERAFDRLVRIAPAQRRRLLLGAVGAAAVAAGGAVARCGLPGRTAPREGPGAAGRQPDPAEVLAERQALHLNHGADPETLDPHKVALSSEIAIVMRVFANLLAFDAGGNLVPEMAERLPAIAPDGRTLTFTLRAGLKYSNGQPLTARDFEYGWKRQLDPRVGGEYAFTGFAIEGGEEFNAAKDADEPRLTQLRDAVGVRARDDRTLEFRLTRPAPWFLSVLTTWCGAPVRQDLVQQAGDRWTEPETYVGNGPYVVKTWEPRNRITLEANPHYYRGAPPVRIVELLAIGDPAVALAAYRNGELDVLAVQGEDLAVVNADPHLKRHYQRFPGSCTTYLGFNTTQPPFDRPAVRRAFAAALDRDDFVSSVLGGLGVAAQQLVPPGLPGHFEDLKPQRLDAAQARRWLADGGYPDGRGFPAVKFTHAAGARNRLRVEAVIEQIRRHLGVTVVADPVEPRALTAMMRSRESTPALFLNGWCQDYPDPQDWYSAVFHSQAPLNHSGWANAEFDRLTQQADGEPDARRRTGLYKRAAQLLMDEAPVAFLYHSVVSRLVQPYVAGLLPNPLDLYEGQTNLFHLRILKH